MALGRSCFPFLFFKQKGVQTLKLGLGSYTVVFRKNINQPVSKVTRKYLQWRTLQMKISQM